MAQTLPIAPTAPITPFAAIAFALAAAIWPRSASASNPLEFPDHGAEAFGRSGAWLATGALPLATHFSPATLAIGRTALSVDVLATFNEVCFDRRDENNDPTGPAPGFKYVPVCADRTGFPTAVPAMAASWRLAEHWGAGIAFVPPATYSNSYGQFPETALGFNERTGQPQQIPAPYRFLQLDSRSTLAFPTAAVGWEAVSGLRFGAGFIWGFMVVDSDAVSIQTVDPTSARDDARLDNKSRFRTADWFVPGAVASVHWSPTSMIDLSVWGRYLDSARAHDGSLELRQQYYSPARRGDAPPFATSQPDCQVDALDCGADVAVVSRFSEDTRLGDPLIEFEFRVPPEVRAGVRFHLPHDGGAPRLDDGFTVRDPLHDDVFDVEFDGSYTMNSHFDTLRVQLVRTPGGGGAPLDRGGTLPPVGDRKTGYIDSVGVRFGGQWNAIRDKLGVRGGTWYETRSADPGYLTVNPVAGARGGFGGGLVIRQEGVDLSFGYQRHYNQGLDNEGKGKIKAAAGSAENFGDGFSLNNEPADQQFKSFHAINGGRVDQAAHVFNVGIVVGF